VTREIYLSRDRYWIVLSLGALVLVIFRFLLSPIIRVEDYQEVAFLFVIALFYLLQKYLGVGISRKVFIVLVLFWLLLQARVFLMRELGYYNGKVLISKLVGDNEGYQARAIARGIKVMGKTYHLSGPALIPYDLEGRDIERWFSIKKRPALIITSSTTAPLLELPIVELYSSIISGLDLVNRTGKEIWLEKDALKIKIPLYDSPIILPLPPSQVSLEGESANVIKHYVGWLSGYFHPEFSKRTIVRQDTIHEVAKIDSPWKNDEPRALARYLKSMEEIFEIYPNFGDPQVKAIQVRLAKTIFSLKKGDLYSSVQSLRALLFVVQGQEKKAKRIFMDILNDQSFSERQRAIAARNLGTLELR